MARLIYRGDVIRTNPFSDYWGVAVVLSECGETSEFEPMCHIALTPLVFRHAVEFEELNSKNFKVLERENHLISLFGFNPHANKVIAVYSRITKSPISIIGSVDPTPMYDGPLPFSPDYGLTVTWPLGGTIDKNLGWEAINSWLRENDPKALDGLFSENETLGLVAEQEEVSQDELWIMIETNNYFLSADENSIEEELIDLVESAGLGEFDGHSSGGHQFDMNFFGVGEFCKTKKLIANYLSKNHPKLKYEISNSYGEIFGTSDGKDSHS